MSGEVVGGTYDRTYTNPGSTPTGLADPASVSDFRLDEYLVTVGRFRQFVNAWNVGYNPPAGSGKHTHLNGGNGLVAVGADAGLAYEPGWISSDDSNVEPSDSNLGANCGNVLKTTWTDPAGSQENLPINCTTWQEAYAFCIWDGGFLPSEAEWEYAAAGGNQQREYAWGSASPGTGSQYAIFGCYYPSGSSGCEDSVANIAPVGTPGLGIALWGQYDMAGELWEWVLDNYASSFPDPCTDCAYLVTGAVDRVAKGGDWGFGGATPALSPTDRSSLHATTPVADRYLNVGFRCARVP
jgi:formylglycine-generating enzyme required for sulfatase activity